MRLPTTPTPQQPSQDGLSGGNAGIDRLYATLAEPRRSEPSVAELRATGARVTRPRLAILRLLVASERALSHRDVRTALAGERIGRITIYRTLEWLTNLGLACKYIDNERTSRFTFGRRSDSLSASFACRVCGDVYPLSIERQWRIDLPKGLRLEEAHMRLRGTCISCNPGAGNESTPGPFVRHANCG